MSEEMIFRLITLGIPFIIGLFVPQKSKQQIDAEIEKKVQAKFGAKK